MNGQGNLDIHIVGLGIVHVGQITRETERLMAESNEVLYVERGIAIDNFLRQLCPRVTNLTTLYADEGDRQETYRRMAASVITAALDHPPVTFALYGHPLIFSYPPFLVQQMATYFDLRVRVLPAVSAMDCIFADLSIDPSMNGLQMYEATDLLLRRRPLHPDVPALIWQIGALETGLYSTHASRPERFQRFLDHLLSFYHRNHLVFAVHSATHPMMKSEVLKFPLGEISAFAAVLHAGFSLYIPPVSARPIEDWQLARQLSDPIHLRRITLEERRAT